MSKALVIAKSAGVLTVEIERDLTKLTKLKSNLEESILRLVTQDTIAADRLSLSEAALDLAVQQLNLAISNSAPNTELALLSAQVSSDISIVAKDRKALSFIVSQKLTFEQKLTLVDVELLRDITIPITMADTGSNIQVGQTIGLAEITRLNNPDSIYIALPSDSAVRPNRQIYNATRDGITLPILGSEPRGWFYNTMIVPSAQIYRPRYWLAEILQIHHNVNDAVIYIHNSTDFEVVPTHQNRVLESGVLFEYENTNSRAFSIGDLVLVEYSGTTPLIIGFGSNERLNNFGGAAPYDVISTGGSFTAIYNGRVLSDMVNPLMSSESGGTQRSTSDDVSANVGFARPLLEESMSRIEKIGPNNAEYGALIQGQTQKLINEHAIFAIGISGLNQNYFVVGTDLNMSITVRGSPLFVTPMFTAWRAQNDAVPSGLADYIGRSITGVNVQRTIDDRNDTGYIFNFIMDDFTAGGPANSSDEFDKSASRVSNKMFLNDSSPESPSTFTKLAVMAEFGLDGSIVPLDYLWSLDKIKVPTGFEGEILMVTTRSTQPGTLIESVFNNFFGFKTGFTVPSPDYDCTPIAVNGTQNLIPFSEDFNHNMSADFQEMGDPLKAPDCTMTGQQWMQPEQGSNKRFDFSFPDLFLVPVDLTYSIHLRRNSYMDFEFTRDTGTGLKNIDLVAGTAIPTAGVTNSGIIPLDGDWYRLWFSVASVPVGRADEAYLQIRTLNGIGLNGVAIWGLQVTQGLNLQTYVKTTGAAIP